jgi:hypothetical protein
MLDEDGQPSSLAFNSKLRIDRETDELIGLCKGLLADGEVNEAEANFLLGWLQRSSETCDEWPANVLFRRVSEMLRDGRLDQSEEGQLLTLLVSITGGDPGRLNAHSLSSGLPLDQPMPPIRMEERRFCFTGKFLWGPRDACHREVVRRGGVVGEAITKELSYLVIGVVGSRDWVHSAYGRKIQKAVEYRGAGVPLAIVSEEHFVRALTP